MTEKDQNNGSPPTLIEKNEMVVRSFLDGLTPLALVRQFRGSFFLSRQNFDEQQFRGTKRSTQPAAEPVAGVTREAVVIKRMLGFSKQ
jgi:hypothetical protein